MALLNVAIATFPSSPCSPISSSSSVSHLSQTSLESSNGQPSPVSTTLIPTPPPPIPPPPPPPPITRQRLTNLQEYDALMKNRTWSLVPRDSNTNVVDGKWVYRLKRDKNGVITRYKARFVAKGFRQQPGIDFHETFSPVVKSTTIRAVLSLAVTNDWPLRQLDIQNAFLHGNLKEKVYMKQPPGFIDPQRPNHVCLLHKSLYDLKQAPRAWFERLSKALFDLGFKCSKTNPYLFNYSHGDTLLYILVYVDDIIVIVKRILRYLHGTIEHGMLIRRSSGSTLQAFIDVLWKGNPDTSLEAFLDADWARDSDDRWSTRGFAIYLEAKCKALAGTVAELTWLQALPNELGIHSSSTPILWCDNICATYFSANPIFHARRKHVEIDYHFVREKVSQGDI
ncbi:retrotransposon protein, putative, ty1-copia subclass [Tanacetum coccineum]